MWARSSVETLPEAPGAKGHPPMPPSEASRTRAPACIEARALASPMPRVLWMWTTNPLRGQRRLNSRTIRAMRAGSPIPIESHRNTSSTPRSSYFPARP